MKNQYISIIIPCYNVEKYLDSCLQSIINQTFKNYEIIFVDDCSTDNTYNIIKEYEKKYDYIKALKNPVNSGAGAARNLGLKEAKYDIISFIDSDDTIESNYHELLLNSMIKEKSDISVCDIYTRFDENFDISESDNRQPSCVGEVNKDNIINNPFAASPCNKLIKKELLLNNPFPTNMMNEDIPTIIGCVIDSKKISYTKDTYYNYIQHKSSVQNSKITYKRFDIFKALDILSERKSNNKDFNKYLNMLVYQQLILFFAYAIPKDKSFINRYKILRRYSKLIRKYDISNNPYYNEFLDKNPPLSKKYYKYLLLMEYRGFCLLTNLIIQSFNIYRHFKKSGVIKKNIGINDLVKEAKKQQNYKDNNVKLSVVIPNYNYSKFLYQRLYSILYQKEKIDEIIVLDDCSTDNSRELIDEIVDNLKDYINIRKVYNEKNSGTAFKQWQKGFKEASNDYVWIAEADDYCSNKFLESALKPIKENKNIVISYVDTAFINVYGHVIMKTIKPEIDIMKTGHWDNSFVNNGLDEISKYSYLNCTIANVSSVIFKNSNYEEFFKLSGEYKQAGDWLFYVNVMSKGDIAFHNAPLNYYRVHGNNVTSTTKKQQHLDEIKRVHSYIDNKIKFNKEQKNEIEKRYEFLRMVWDLNER